MSDKIMEVILFYLYILTLSCKMVPITIATANVSLTTSSFFSNQTLQERCDFAFEKDNFTSELDRLKSDHSRIKRNIELLTVNFSNCRLESVKNLICNLCSISRNVSVDMSWNIIQTLEEMECNCPDIVEIDFSNNDLAVLRANSFIFAQNVRRICMSRNHISNLENYVFNELKMLESLDLSRNALRRVDLNIFNSLNNLRKLDLAANRIKTIVFGNFIELVKLEELDVSNNDIHSLDSSAFKGMKHLRYLNLAANKLSNSKLHYLSTFLNLSIVNLSRNSFKCFDEGSLSGFNIYEIILNNLSNLKYILDGAFRNGSCLTKLDLSRNKNLIFIAESAFQNMPDYIILDVSYTQLKSFPMVSDNMTVKATEAPLRCECSSVADVCSRSVSSQDDLHLSQDDHFSSQDDRHSSQDDRYSSQDCVPSIVSKIADKYFLYVGERLEIDCFAVGQPKPRVTWERIYSYSNGTISSVEPFAESYLFSLYISSLNLEGKYRCAAESDNVIVHKYFHIRVKKIDIGIKVLSRSSQSVLVTWNKTHKQHRRVLLYRAFETTSDYVVQKLDEYWKVFIVRSLQPFTEYEICIASFSDNNDKSCVRVMTSMPEKTSVGIRHNNLAITFLVISGIVFGVFLLVVIYRCIHKVRIISRQKIFIVGSESRDCFADITESTFTYENHHTERLIDTA